MIVYSTPRGNIYLETRCPAKKIGTFLVEEGLGIFCHFMGERQRELLVKVAQMSQGEVTIARTESRKIAGFVTLHPPSPLERWGQQRIPGLIELGGIEVARVWRKMGVSRKMLEETFNHGDYEDRIIIGQGFRWCWDFEEATLSLIQYGDMLKKLLAHFGFKEYLTDEPNISCYPGNFLVARIGSKVNPSSYNDFKSLLYQ